jgi:hypothetical protein
VTPEQLSRRHDLLREHWPSRMPVRAIIALMDQDGEHWKDARCRCVASELGLRRPPPLPPDAGGRNDPSDEMIRASSERFHAAFLAVYAGGGSSGRLR